MKTFVKKIFALILSVGLCFALCSCDMGKSDAQGYYKDEAKTEIVFDNNTYKLLDVKIDDDIYVNAYNPMTVGEEGAPAILATLLGDDMLYNDQKTIIEFIDDDLNSVCYCREDVYDEILKTIENLELNYVCYSVWDDGNTEDFMLDDDIAKAVAEIVSSQTPKKEEFSSEKFVALYKCDKDMTFQKEYVDVDLTDDGEYIISGWDEDYNTLVYEIPAEKLDMFKTLVDTYGAEVSLW